VSGWTRAFSGNARGPRDVDSALRSALLAVLERDLDTAEEMITSVLRTDSSGLTPYLALAGLYRMRGEVGRAIRIHQNLLLRADLDERSRAVVLAHLAGDFLQGGFLRRAIASYEEVLDGDPKHLPALRALVRLYADVREFPRAIEVARRLAKREGRNSDADVAGLLVEGARVEQAEGRNEDARKTIKKALRRDRGRVLAWLTLGDLEAERGKTRAALAAWSKIPELEIASGHLVYAKLEATYAALGKPREFETFVRRLLDTHADDPGLRLALARHLSARGDVDLAVQELSVVLERWPDHIEARGVLARLFLSEHREADAARALGDLLDVLDRQGLLAGEGKLP